MEMFNASSVLNNKRTLYVLGVFIFVFNGSFGIITYSMEGFCYSELSFILESIYQAKLKLTDNNLIDKADSSYPYKTLGYCEATVEAWYTYFPKLMFYFEDFGLDCDIGHLEFYEGKESGVRVVGLSYDVCGKVKPSGIYVVHSRHLQIRYVPLRKQYASDLFSLIITSFGDGPCPSHSHKCGNSRCVHEDDACNDYNSCGDNTGCDLETGEIVGIIVGCIAGVVFIISLVVCCICCRRRSRGSTGTVQNTGTRTQAVAYTGLQTTGQPMYAQSQGSPFPANVTTYPVATPANAAIPNSNQQGYIAQNYGFNQGTRYQSNQAPSEKRGHVDPSAPPPSYDEIMANSKHVLM